jgi:hypothetical protein
VARSSFEDYKGFLKLVSIKKDGKETSSFALHFAVGLLV